MHNTRSRTEARLERMLATTPPPSAQASRKSIRIDFVYLTEDGQRRLDESLRGS